MPITPSRPTTKPLRRLGVNGKNSAAYVSKALEAVEATVEVQFSGDMVDRLVLTGRSLLAGYVNKLN